MPIKILHLNDLTSFCGYFESETGINNGYGCTHPENAIQEEYEDGKRGWDKQYSELRLIQELVKDAIDIENNTPLGEFKITLENVLSKRLIDVAARAMIIWYRHNQSLNQTDAG